jgi:lipopolysaccharide export system protein LptC
MTLLALYAWIGLAVVMVIIWVLDKIEKIKDRPEIISDNISTIYKINNSELMVFKESGYLMITGDNLLDIQECINYYKKELV